jgi:hypothetical protein
MRISVETEVESIPAQVLKQNIQLSCFFFYEGRKKEGEEKTNYHQQQRKLFR